MLYPEAPKISPGYAIALDQLIGSFNQQIFSFHIVDQPFSKSNQTI